MTIRTMRTSTNNPPPPFHNNYPCPRPKSWPSPPPYLTARSPTRTRLNNRTYPLHMTKTCTIRPSTSTPAQQPNPSYSPRSLINTHRRLRRTKPNPTTKNFSLLIHCPPRLNDSSPTIFTHPHSPHTRPLSYHNLLLLPHLPIQQNHNN